MKRPFVTAVFFCLTMASMTSWINEKKHIDVPLRNSKSGMNNDSTDYLRLLKIDSFNLTIIPPSTGVQFYKDGIVFLSPTKNEDKMSPKFVSFGTMEAYYAVVEDTILGKHKIFSPLSSFSYPCEAITFSQDFNSMYFTKLTKKGTKEKIYRAKFNPGTNSKSAWLSEINPLDFCNDKYTYTHPALSVDGEVLVFASDREGTFGGMDLFITRKVEGKWSSPQNLGKMMNSSGNELYPFLDSDNNLFFSSDGLAGFGGYDIFTCKFNGEGWDKPMNLSRRINSEYDDIAFTISKVNGKTAFYTKRLNSGKRELQLLKVIINEDVADTKLMTISYVFNGKPLVNTSLTSMNIFSKGKPLAAEPPKAESKPESVKKDTVSKALKNTVTNEVKKEEVKAPVTVAKVVSSPEKKTIIQSKQNVKPPEAKVVVIKPTIATPDEQKDIVIYRVQYISSNLPQKDKQIIINGKSYIKYEYFYLGAYRYTIGEFRTLAPAIELQNTCRSSGYPQAFVAAFKNNTRSLDLKLFK